MKREEKTIKERIGGRDQEKRWRERRRITRIGDTGKEKEIENKKK